jgi:4-hydroxybutyryl-CoA dehydratase/vinylacetyl-CoA-Delta-isomerase
VPADEKGVYQIVGRQSSDTRKIEEGNIDRGNVCYGCVETLTIFDDVFVPWDRVFLYKERDMPVRAMEIFGGTHRVSSGAGCMPGIIDVWIGAAALIADYNGLANKKHIRNKIAEMIIIGETIRGGALAACHEGTKAPSGGYLNDFLLGNSVKYYSSQQLFELIKLMNYPAGGQVLTQPSEADFRSKEVGRFIDKYLKGKADVSTENRLRMMRFIETNSIGCHNHLGELHGAGSPQTQLDIAYATGNLEHKKNLAKKLAGIQE